MRPDTWDWSQFKGSDVCLRINRRDLVTCERIVSEVPKRRVAVQAGGNLGIFAKFLSHYFQSVYTFEPAPELFPLLARNAPEPNIVKMQAALSDRVALVGTKCARLYPHTKPPHEGVTHVVPDGIVPSMPLDMLRLPVCDLIYLDVEGYELHALRGAYHTITECRPVVVVEINDCITARGHDPAHVIEFMRDAGYHFNYKTTNDDYVFIPK